jgi:hypothetical protein
MPEQQPETPWSLTVADGSANVYRFTRAAAAAHVQLRYEPITPETSSTGMYSGGPPREEVLEASDPQLTELWTLIHQLEASTADHTPERGKGTGAITWKSPAGKHQFILQMGERLNGLLKQLKLVKGVQQRSSAGDPHATAVMPWPRNWSSHLGHEVTVEGIAQNAKLGALLVSDGADIWIDGLSWWPDSVLQAAKAGKRVRVTGTAIERYDLPVFIPQEENSVKGGILVSPGSDLRDASRRFLLKNATWTLRE